MDLKFSSKIYQRKYSIRLFFVYLLLKLISLVFQYIFLVPHCNSKSRLYSNTTFALRKKQSKKVILIYSPLANLYFYKILRKKYFGINNLFIFKIMYSTYLQYYKDKDLWCDTYQQGMYNNHKSLIQLKIISKNNLYEKSFIQKYFKIYNFNKLVIIANREKDYSDYNLIKPRNYFDKNDFRTSKFKTRIKMIKYLIKNNYQIVLMNEGKKINNNLKLNIGKKNIINFYFETKEFKKYIADKLFITLIRNCKLVVSDLSSVYSCSAAFGKKYFLTNTFPYVEKNRTDNDYIMFKYTKNKSNKFNKFSNLKRYNFEKNIGYIYENDLQKFLINQNKFIENNEDDFLNSIKDILSNKFVSAKKFHSIFLRKYFNKKYTFKGKIPKSHFLKLVKILK
tara:strand:+ start:152 stop:1333 length:1182 start_codon:yes stop_codon:yes gene_type:complete